MHSPFVVTYQNRCSRSRGCRRRARAPGRATAGSAWAGTAARVGCRRRACGAARQSGELLAALYPGPAGLHVLGLDHEGRTHRHVTQLTWLLPYPTKSLKKQLPFFFGLYFLGQICQKTSADFSAAKNWDSQAERSAPLTKNTSKVCFQLEIKKVWGGTRAPAGQILH